MNPPAPDSFDRYDAQPGRQYLALETDSPMRWQAFAICHPQFKALETDNPERLLASALSHPLFKPVKHEESNHGTAANS